MRKSSIIRASAAMSSALITAPYIGHLSAYANTLTRLIPDLYAGLDVVSRELVGFVPSAYRNSSVERAAVGQSVVYPVSAQKAAFDVTPAMAIPEPSDTATGNGVITISKTRGVEFGWTGEEQRGLNNNGPGYLSVQADNFAQALRTLTNEVETDLALAAMLAASRAYGTAGTTPFGTNVGESAQVRKILDDNGAPATGRSLIIDTTAGAALRTLSNLTRANEAGTTMTLRDGQLLDLNGLSIKESAKVQTFVAGTNNGSAAINNAGYAVGATVFTLASLGTGTIKAGDVVTFAGDTNKYVVVSGDADVSNGGTFTIAKPGILKAVPASNTVITTIASHTANIGFSQNALHLVFRLPALPAEGDAAIDRRTIIDPRSGLVFEVAVYPGYRKVRLEVVAAWGVGAVKAEHIAMLLG